MAIANGVHAVAADNTGNATTTASRTSQATGSNFYIAISYPSGETLTSVTDSKSNTYTQIDTLTDAGNAYIIAVYKSENGTGGASHTATLTLGATARKVIYFWEVTGAATSSSVDQHAIVKDTSSPFDQTVTTTQAAEIVYSFVRSGDIVGVTFTPNGSFSTLDSESSVSASQLAYRAVSSTGTYGPAFTASGGSNAQVATFSVKEAGGGGGTAFRGTLLLGVG